MLDILWEVESVTEIVIAGDVEILIEDGNTKLVTVVEVVEVELLFDNVEEKVVYAVEDFV